MGQKEIETYCTDNGVPFDVVGDRLRVMDLTRLPDRMRAQFDERGFLRTPDAAAVVKAETSEDGQEGAE
jgi:hypothetical protein